MRHILYIFILLLACSCTNSQAPETDKAEPATDTIPVLVMQIQKCSKLYTAEYNIHKIVTHDDVVRLQGKFLSKNFDIKMPVGDRKIAIPIDATLKAYVDFKDFSEQNIVRSGNKITVILPDPKVAMTSSKVDHNNIKEFVSLTRSDFTDEEMSNFEQQGRKAIIRSIPYLGIIETALDNAAHTLIPIIMQLGYQERDITITFRKEYGENDIDILLDKTTIEKR